MLKKSQSIFAQNIHFYRKRLKLTQKQLAQMVGCTASFIGYIENGKTNVPLETIENLSIALQVAPETLFSEEVYDGDFFITEGTSKEYSPQLANVLDDLKLIIDKYEQK